MNASLQMAIRISVNIHCPKEFQL